MAAYYDMPHYRPGSFYTYTQTYPPATIARQYYFRGLRRRFSNVLTLVLDSPGNVLSRE